MAGKTDVGVRLDILSDGGLAASNKARGVLTGDDVFRDRLGVLYRAGVAEGHAQRLGQYFTPDAVCDLMLAWAVQSGGARILDPGCGAGGFLLRAADRLIRHQAGDPSEALACLHGVDLDAQAAGLCAGQLSEVAARYGLSLQPAIRVGDFLAELPADFRDFDAIVGNPPYVRQELLRDKKAAWSGLLKDAYADYLVAYPMQQALFGPGVDLYLLFLLRATRLLNPGGKLALVMSNSWMDTALAAPMMRFLSHWFHLRALVEPGVETWFEDAAVNPVILLAERKADWTESNPYPVRLVQLKRPLAELTSGTWPGAETLVQTVLSGESVQNSALSIRSVSQRQLTEPQAGRSSFYLRADVDFQALRECRHLWRPVSDFGTVRYPLKTGINRFFYLTRETAENFGIEPEFLMPVLKSAREVTHLTVGGQQARWFLFTCPHSVAELEAAGKTGALSYIRRGETQVAPSRQKRHQPVPWPQVASVQGRPHWYAIKSLPPADLLCSRFFDRRFFFATVNPADALLEDQTFYGLTLNKPGSRKSENHGSADSVLLAALLNATVSYLWVELLGRTNLGEGALQYSRRQMADHWLPNPALYDTAHRVQITEAFRVVSARAILPIDQEVAMADRQALDRLVLAPMERDPLRVADGLCEAVQARRQRAKSRRAYSERGDIPNKRRK